MGRECRLRNLYLSGGSGLLSFLLMPGKFPALLLLFVSDCLEALTHGTYLSR
jgi:hypothetical protein